MKALRRWRHKSEDKDTDAPTATPYPASSSALDTPDPASGAAQADSSKLGRLQFSLGYDPADMTLTLKVIRATDLAIKDITGSSDPYVKILLLPDKKTKLTTSIKRRNLNPWWNETFAFEGYPFDKLQNRTLLLQVLDYDRLSRDDPIGEVRLPLCEVDFSKTQAFCRTLQPCKGHVGSLGEVLLSLKYQPKDGILSVGVIKAWDLKAMDINGLSDPYVKIWLMHNGRRVEKKKTVVREKTLNPVYEQTIRFSVPLDRIRQTSVAVSVVDFDRLGRNERIGQVVLGNRSGQAEVRHWTEMFAQSRNDVTRWHALKDFG